MLSALPKMYFKIPQGAQTCSPADLKDVLTRFSCWGWGLLPQAAFLAV